MSFEELKILVQWFKNNARPLPWRRTKNPYFIWISEVMLQQTTSKAAIPYYEKFIKVFPHVKKLAQSQEKEVLRLWSGLGYYTRARNLRVSAQMIHKNGFPKTHKDLLKLKGFGDYTARAVSSLAFGEKVGVLDGNVIRFLCRKENLKIKWWETTQKRELQKKVDAYTQNFSSNIINQALMEIGGTICTPQSPTCSLCPVRTTCKAFKYRTVTKLPLKKIKKPIEYWLLQFNWFQNSKNQVQIMRNSYAPFFKNQWLFPGQAKQIKAPPKRYHFTHRITHHKIFVKINQTKVISSKTCLKNNKMDVKKSWISQKQIPSYIHSSLGGKTLQYINTID